MTIEHRNGIGSLPDDLVRLDRELRGIQVEERASFSEELRVRLVDEHRRRHRKRRLSRACLPSPTPADSRRSGCRAVDGVAGCTPCPCLAGAAAGLAPRGGAAACPDRSRERDSDVIRHGGGGALGGNRQRDPSAPHAGTRRVAGDGTAAARDASSPRGSRRSPAHRGGSVPAAPAAGRHRRDRRRPCLGGLRGLARIPTGGGLLRRGAVGCGGAQRDPWAPFRTGHAGRPAGRSMGGVLDHLPT